MLNEIQQEVESLPHSQSINPMLRHSGDVPELLPTDQWTLEEVRLEFLWPSPPFHNMHEQNEPQQENSGDVANSTYL